jgi:hypothetical protein
MTKPAKLILTDCDEVILHWTDAFTNWLKTEKSIFPTKYRNSHYISTWLDIHPDEACDLVVEFNSSKHFEVLEPYDCATDYLPKLHSEGARHLRRGVWFRHQSSHGHRHGSGSVEDEALPQVREHLQVPQGQMRRCC